MMLRALRTRGRRTLAARIRTPTFSDLRSIHARPLVIVGLGREPIDSSEVESMALPTFVSGAFFGRTLGTFNGTAGKGREYMS